MSFSVGRPQIDSLKGKIHTVHSGAWFESRELVLQTFLPEPCRRTPIARGDCRRSRTGTGRGQTLFRLTLFHFNSSGIDFSQGS